MSELAKPDVLVPNTSTMYQRSGIVSDELKWWLYLINFVILCGGISVLGMIWNVINMIVFLKQGLHTNVNISLFGLAVSDFGCLITLFWLSLCYNPLVINAELPFDPVEVQYITGGNPHLCFVRMTTWFTAFIAFERCLCITAPLKVNNIITPRRTKIFAVFVFIFAFASQSPAYYTSNLGWKFNKSKNRTILGLVFAPNREEIEGVMLIVNNVFLQILSFSFIVVFTVVLVVKLKSKTKWRQAVGTAGKEKSTVRDKKVVKMVTLICCVFIFTFFPVTIIFVGMIAEPDFIIGGRYTNLLLGLCSFTFLFEGTSSSVNIFIYLRMSSSYKATFDQIFSSNKQ